MSIGISNSPTPATANRATPRGASAVIASAVFMANLDLFIVNVAVPAMGRSFHGSALDSLSWVLNGYAIAFAALLVPAGRIADRCGHRPVFLTGLAVFTLASAACALSPDVTALIVARSAQATGAAAMMPTSLALILATTAPGLRARSVRAWASIGAIAAGLGPVLGGLLVEAGWRWVFLANLPVGAAAIVFGRRVLPKARPAAVAEGARAREPFPDVLGAALLTVSIGLLALGLVRSADRGWTDPRTLGCLAAAVVTGVWFLHRSAGHPVPIVDLSLFRVRAFSAAAGALALFTVAFAASLLGAVLWCQEVWGYSALMTGLAITPGPLVVPPIALRIGPAISRFGAGRVALIGCLAAAVGALWWAATLGRHSAYATTFLPGWILIGVGVGLNLPVLTGAAASALPPERFATGSAVSTMGRQIGSVLGVAMLVGVLGTPRTDQTVRAFQHGWYAIAAAAILAALATIPLQRRI